MKALERARYFGMQRRIGLLQGNAQIAQHHFTPIEFPFRFALPAPIIMRPVCSHCAIAAFLRP